MAEGCMKITHQACRDCRDGLVEVYSRWDDGTVTLDYQRGSDIIPQEHRQVPSDLHWIRTDDLTAETPPGI